MKKFTIILLMLVYGTATMGTTIQHHFCMDEYVGWSFYRTTDDTCGRCGMDEEESEGCCKNENEHFKLKTDHQASPNLATKSPDFILGLINSISVIEEYSPNNITETYPLCHAPPDIGDQNLYLFYSVFRI